MKTKVFVSLAVLAASSAASASNWNLTFDGYGCGSANGKINTTNNSGSNWFKVNASLHDFTRGNGKQYSMFCIQWEDNLPSPGNGSTWCDADLADLPDDPGFGPMGAARAEVINDLFSRFYGQVKSGDEKACAAFQLLLWEIVQEQSLDTTDASTVVAGLSLTAGNYRAQATGSDDTTFAQDAIDCATDWIAELGDGGFQTFANLRALSDNATDGSGFGDPFFQDLIAVVPIPAPVVLAGLGLLGVGLARRRSK